MNAAFVQKLEAVVGTWGRPPDLPSRVALGLAVALALAALFGRGRTILGAPAPTHDVSAPRSGIADGEVFVSRRLFLWGAAFAAAMLSVLYIAEYLRGGPRIIDATTYFLQGRVLSEGSFAWPVAEPTASFRGRFLLYRDGAMGGIFPPGYPLLLAFGFALGAPMIVGPILAALLVVATYRCARTIAEDVLGAANELVEPVARGAAILSVFCAALRYHTADTMAHGAAALGVIVALDAALRARRPPSRNSDGETIDGRGAALLAGLAIGFVVATRPVSALPIAIVAFALLRKRRALLVRAAIAVLPGVFLLLLAQRSVTGAWLTSAQRMYYAISDGPPGCFRWGFGKDTGCVVEHGAFVKDRLGSRYGPIEALLVTLRRLRMHVLDVANLEPLALFVLVPLARRPRHGSVLAALSVVLLQILAYAPFYFDGDYPGGGARFFADVLPIEHALVAIALAGVATRSARVRAFTRALAAFAALALAGFAFHASFDHGKLRDRDGGRPMFEPDLLQSSHATAGLVYVDTDHGFALGHDPNARVSGHVVVARLRNDDRDRILYDRLDRPPSWLYRFETPPAASGAPPLATASVVPWAPPGIANDTYRFEADAEWPALAQSGGFAAPADADCASNKRVLVVAPTPALGTAEATIEIPVPETGRYSVTLRIAQNVPFPHVEAVTGAATGTAKMGGETFSWTTAGIGCIDLPAREMELTTPSTRLVLSAHGGSIAVDTVTLRHLK